MSRMQEHAERYVADIIKQASAKVDPNGQAGYDGLYDNVMAFVHAVDWKNEQWLQALLAGQVLLWVVTIATRRRMYVQAVVFVLVCAVVRLLETFNSYAAANWRNFSTQNYFDKNGVFLGVVLAMPLILLLVFQVINSVLQASHLLVVQKRAELRGIKPGQTGEGKKNK